MISLLIDRGNAPAGGGIGEYVQGLVWALKQYRPEIGTVCETGIGSPSRSLRPLRRLLYLWRLRSLRSRGFDGADLVHFANLYTPPAHGTVRYVTSVHDLDPVLLPGVYTARYRAYFGYIIRKTMRRARLMITQTEAVRSELLNTFPIQEERVVVGGDGLGPGFTACADRTPKVLPEVPTMLFVGQIGKKKNVPWLVRTFVEGVRKGAIPDMRLILAGKAGLGSSEVLREVRSAGVLVSWLRGAPQEQIIGAFCGCTMVVLPSLREGFGRTLLEAMYCRKPIVASRIPSSLEVAGDAASYFSLEDKDGFYAAVAETLSGRHDERRKRIAEQQVQKYSWKRLADVYHDIYQRGLAL